MHTAAPWLGALAAAAAAAALVTVAGCGDAKHEPVKVIAAPRSAPPAPAPLPAPTLAATPPAPAALPAASSSAPAAPARAAASVPVLPGFNDRPPRFVQAGEPTGNAAFRRAFADRAASRPH